MPCSPRAVGQAESPLRSTTTIRCFAASSDASAQPLGLVQAEQSNCVQVLVDHAGDDLVSIDPWTPCMLKIRGRADAIPTGGLHLRRGFGEASIRIYPEKINNFGIA
jgi:hypothetical protein